MTTVFKLGLMCTNTLPSHRPSMKEVLYVLRQQGLEGAQKTAAEAPEAPLLVSLSGRRTSKRVEDEALEYAYTSKVDEKIDVYSFGVVLLELVTGREGNNGDEHTNLADWSWRHYQSKKPITEAFDEDIKEASSTEEMTTVFKLGLMCTNTLPSHRPSMKEVLYVLRQQGLEGAQKTAAEAPEAPLLVSLSGRRTTKRVEDEALGFV
ncbi:hypothetical protein F2Q70_00032337 [Brassica cretica]|uniref:Serine-threonine/tyrosine-protein kinase catalytic domain-containing protein n=1 Tax=Brassica cretica TaxID=69181 RepID=A0A8S9FFV5_BRACR|nr:hypothetical protein F2Q70_00032337 [Brassica cretica]